MIKQHSSRRGQGITRRQVHAICEALDQRVLFNALPNLALTGFAYNATFLPGDTISITPSIENSGVGDSGSFAIAFYLSPTSNFNSSTAMQIGMDNYPSVAAGDALTLTAAAATIPANISPGQYFVIGVADPTNQIAESDETDNTLVGTALTIKPIPLPPPNQPDLFFSLLSFTPGSYTADDSFTFTPTVGNVGIADSGPVTIQTDLSIDTIFGNADDITLGSVTVNNIAAGATVNLGAKTITLPATLPIGGYRVISRIDPTNSIAEPDKTNNTSISADSAVTIVAPPKIVTDTGVGTLNPDFGDNGVASTTFQNLLFSAVDARTDSTGRLVAAGYTTNTGDFFVGRFNADGSLDPTFGDNGRTVIDLGRGTFDTATSIAIDPNTGAIYVAGYSQSPSDSSDNDFAIARFTADGLVDNTFSDDGVDIIDLARLRGQVTSDDRANAITLSGGKIYLAGSTQISGDDRDFALLRLTGSGDADTSFSGDGLAVVNFFNHDDAANAMVVQSDGRVVLAGSAQNSAGTKTFIAAARINNNGSLDTVFGQNGKFTLSINNNDDEAFAADVYPNGAIALGGFSATGNASDRSLTTKFAVVKISANGDLDRSFNNGAAVTAIPGDPLAAVNQLVIQPTGKILVAGKGATSIDNAFSGNVGVVLARYTLTGTLDTTFNGTGILKLFTPPVAPGAPTDLSSQFNQFANSATGIVDLTPGGGILALASSQDTTTNSTTVSVASVVADGVDLTDALKTVGVPNTVLGGAKGSATLTITNEGSLTGAGNIQVKLYLSTDKTLSVDDRALLILTAKLKLSPGKSQLQKVSFTFPKDLPTGSYFLLADVNSDSNAGIVEINTANNVAAAARKTITQPGVDLSDKFSGKIPATIAGGSNALVNVLVINHGNIAAKGKATVKLYAAPSKSDASANVLMFAQSKSINLQPRGSQIFNLSFLLKAGVVPPGTDFLLATVDFAGEKNLADNSVFSASMVVFK
jgi:uncharacterized delta-60 repeat protein